MTNISELSSAVSNAIFLLFLAGIPVYGFFRGVKVYESFVEGAKEGFEVAVRIIPYLVAILVAVGMFRASGALGLLTGLLPDVVQAWGITPEVMSLILMRPLSGGASLGLFGEIISTHGADSLPARLGGVILGSTETTLYVIAVYFGAISITRVRYAIHAGLIADAAGVLASIIVCRIFYG